LNLGEGFSDYVGSKAHLNFDDADLLKLPDLATNRCGSKVNAGSGIFLITLL
jgi:hypothetical protein